MTEFSIYQINTDRDNNRICFLGLDSLERFQHSKEVDPVLYDRTYDGTVSYTHLDVYKRQPPKVRSPTMYQTCRKAL